MKKFLLCAICAIPFLCAPLFAEDASREVLPQGSVSSARQAPAGNPNRDASGSVKDAHPVSGSSAPVVNKTSAPPPERTVGPARPAPAHVGGPRPVGPPPPPRHHHYYSDPYYYYPQTTVIVYEQSNSSEPVYYVAEVPDTIRLVNEFPVTRSLGIHGFFGPYAMTSDYRGYDFGGYLAGAGLTYQIPINDHSLAFVLGAIFTYRTATQTFEYFDDGEPTDEKVRYTFEHLGIDVPLVIRLRGTGSRLSFDFGGKVFFNVHDRLITKDDHHKQYYHLSDDRDLANFGLTLGFNIDLNSFIAFNIGSDFIFGDTYKTSSIRQIPAEFSESELTLGLTFKVF